MFGCLVGGKGTTYDANHVGTDYAHIDDVTAPVDYLLSGAWPVEET
jgi:hypothetical protein